MKVLVISATFPPTRAGEAYHVLYLSRHLADRGLDVHILTTKRKVLTDNFPFKVYPLMRDWSWSDLPRLARFIRGCSPDAFLLIYSGSPYNDHPMITFAPTLSKILVPRATFVTQFENAYLSLRASLFTRALLKAIRRCAGPEHIDHALGTLIHASDRIILLSEYHWSELSERFPRARGKGVVIPPPPILQMSPEDNGASRQRAREAFGVKPDDFLIAYFGYIYSTKGVETLLKAFQRVSSRKSNVRLLMVGGSIAALTSPSYAQTIYELGKQLGIDAKIIWTGEYAWDSDEASVYLRTADACVLPFINGITLDRSSFVAAAAHGLPIVTTTGETLESQFLDQKNVLLCPPNDPESVAVAIDSLIGNADLRRRLRMGALELAHEWFSWEKAVERTIDALQSSPSRGVAEA